MPTSITWSSAPDLLTPREVAQLLRISRSTCYESIRSGDLKPLAVHFGRRILIPKNSLRRLVEGPEPMSDTEEAS